jgi:superfamily II DNA or RNA helicase
MPEREARPLRKWQEEALTKWKQAEHRGIVSVVTGGGKTVFALACVRDLGPETTLVVVPTLALLDQWWEEASSYLGIGLDAVAIVKNRSRLRTGTVNLAVMNTASKQEWAIDARTAGSLLLIVDECHKVASEKFRAVLDIPRSASLGLSATPERPYDEFLGEVLVPALGDVIYTYTYRDALRDGVIVPFALKNVVFELEQERQREYDKLTNKIARAMQQYGPEDDKTVALLLRRARVLNLSLNRVSLALKLVKAHLGQRVLVFHEDIDACNVIYRILHDNGVAAGVYHSKMTLRDRVQMITAYRSGAIQVLVTCRALDEGFNVPETQVGIIAASTATRRQRIQRLGRVLRPSKGKDGAIVYTLVASAGEFGRLKAEEEELEGVASVEWSRA